jgi:predicted RNase H-like nuclease (RuvC/YqgF family)
MDFDAIQKLFQENGIYSVVFALFGSTIVRFIDKLLNQKNSATEEAEKLRAELRGDLEALRKENIDLEESVESWKHRYYIVLEENLRLRMLTNTNFNIPAHITGSL